MATSGWHACSAEYKNGLAREGRTDKVGVRRNETWASLTLVGWTESIGWVRRTHRFPPERSSLAGQAGSRSLRQRCCCASDQSKLDEMVVR
jgi:hypothetical protein